MKQHAAATAALFLASAAEGIHNCNTSQPTLGCYTVTDSPDESQTITAMAAQLHVHPDRLADYNFVAKATKLAPGMQLTVPCARYDYKQKNCGCIPHGGSYLCYLVREHDTFASIAASSSSMSRNETLLRSINGDALYGDSEPAPGTYLRLPHMPCLPTRDTVCYSVSLTTQFRTLDHLASLFPGTSAAAIRAANQGTLGDNAVLNNGMQLSIPDLHGLAPQPCKESQWWNCHTVSVAAPCLPPLRTGVAVAVDVDVDVGVLLLCALRWPQARPSTTSPAT